MRMTKELTDEEVKVFLRDKGWSQRVWPLGRDFLVQRWNDFVRYVEEGDTANWLIDDYWIFLEYRELIHEIGSDYRVKAADKKLRSMLTATDIKHYYKDRNTTYDFWHYGYPKNSKGFFLEQIKCHILESSS